jgi:hypothetical protein
MVYGADNNRGIRSDIFEIVAFFEALHICILANICDRDAAIAFFGDYARVFWHNFEFYLTDQREVAHDFADGLEAMARWASPVEPMNGGVG